MLPIFCSCRDQAALAAAGVVGRVALPAAASLFVNVPIPSIVIDTDPPSLIDPTPSDVPHAITSPGSSVMSWEIMLTCSAGVNTMSDSG
jgi:hypothetical protein